MPKRSVWIAVPSLALVGVLANGCNLQSGSGGAPVPLGGGLDAGADTAAAPDAAVGTGTNGAKAGALLSAPTPVLADEAAAEHTSTEEEKALVVVYWAFLASSSQSGTFDPTVLQSGLQAKVLSLAAEYPTFFTQTPQPGQEVGPGGWFTESIRTPADFACKNSCAPSFGTFFKAGAGVVGAIASLSTAPGTLAVLLDVDKQFLNNLKAGLSLSKAAVAALNGRTDQTLLNIGTAIVQAAGTFAATALQATNIAAVGSVWAAFTAGYAIGSAIELVVECTQWQTSHACGSGCCGEGFTCADPARAVCCPTGKGTVCGTACCAFVCGDPSIELCCGAGEVACKGACVKPASFQTDNANCGMCGNACTFPQTCAAGQCTCEAPGAVCNGKCVDTLHDANNCAMCNQACGPGAFCGPETTNFGTYGECQCNVVPTPGPSVSACQEDPSQPLVTPYFAKAGGTIADGLYVLSANVSYAAPSGQCVPPGIAASWRISGSSWSYANLCNQINCVRSTGNYVATMSGNTVTLREVCVPNSATYSTRTLNFGVSGTDFELQDPAGGFVALYRLF